MEEGLKRDRETGEKHREGREQVNMSNWLWFVEPGLLAKNLKSLFE